LLGMFAFRRGGAWSDWVGGRVGGGGSISGGGSACFAAQAIYL